MGEVAPPSIEQVSYWYEFQQLKLDANYVRGYRNSMRKSETTIAAIRAIASSASIAAWAIWRKFAVIWACFIVASQVADAVRDVFPFRKKRQALSRWCNALDRLFVAAQRDWDGISAGSVTNEKISHLTHQLRTKIQLLEAKYMPDGLSRRNDLFATAQLEMESLFKKRYLK